jgi:hypothetical protein
MSRIFIIYCLFVIGIIAGISCKENGNNTTKGLVLTIDQAIGDTLHIAYDATCELTCTVTTNDTAAPILTWTSSNQNDVPVTVQSGNTCTLHGRVSKAVATVTVSAGTVSTSIIVKVGAASIDPTNPYDPNDPDKVSLDQSMLPILFPDNPPCALTASDGVISIDGGNNKSYWLWGDYFLGTVVNNVRINGTQLVSGNCLTVLHNGISTTYHGGTCPGTATAYLSPADQLPREGSGMYKTIVWPNHGIVQNNILHVFMSVFLKIGTGGLDIELHSTHYWRLDATTLAIIDMEQLSISTQSGAHFGYGVVEHEGYYYTYGSVACGTLCSKASIARAQLVNDKFTNWEVYTGTGWSTNNSAQQPMDGFSQTLVSEQFSVFKHGNKFILLTQNRLGGEIYTFTSDAPWGPWGNRKAHYTTPERDASYTTYNAMAHPQYPSSVGNKLLVSYCVNASGNGALARLNSDVMSYRPRFIWVPYALILE